jgi:hypothetical protein
LTLVKAKQPNIGYWSAREREGGRKLKVNQVQRRPDSEASLSWEDVARLFGPMPDWKIAKIVDGQATYGELRSAVDWAEGGEEARAREGPPSSRVVYFYQIITARDDVGE